MKLATYVRKLKDRSGNYIVPATRSTGVYLNDNQTLQTWTDNVKSWLQKHDGKFDNLYNQLGLDNSTPNWITSKLYAKGSVVMRLIRPVQQHCMEDLGLELKEHIFERVMIPILLDGLEDLILKL